MHGDNAPVMVCPNGHGAFQAGATFCVSCGARLVPSGATGPTPAPVMASAPPFSPPSGPPPQPAWPPPSVGQPTAAPSVCGTCGGNGAGLATDVLLCPTCRWLRPLAPGYTVHCSAFQWAQDGAAMERLRGIGPINAAARAISDRVGRRWIESTFSAVRVSEKQLPGLNTLAVHAARILGMQTMPGVYVSGERMWEAATYGSENSAFVIVGTALLTNFQGKDLLFLLAREMGHCRAGHALWKTVIRFLLGDQGPRKGLGGGMLEKLNPVALVEGTLELPLLAWARQAEITADRAGLLAVGDEEVARRVLLSWCLKSSMLFRHISIPAWMEQMDDSDDQVTRLSEVASSSTPYITRRLKLLGQYASSPELTQYRSVIGPLTTSLEIPQVLPQPQPPGPRPAPGGGPRLGPVAAPPVLPPGAASDDLRIVCPACKTGMRVPRAVLAGREKLNVRCPDPTCGRIVTLKRQPAAGPSRERQLAEEGATDSD